MHQKSFLIALHIVDVTKHYTCFKFTKLPASSPFRLDVFSFMTSIHIGQMYLVPFCLLFLSEFGEFEDSLGLLVLPEASSSLPLLSLVLIF